MKNMYLGLTFIFMLLASCSINSPKKKRELIQMDRNLISNEQQLASILDRLYDLEKKKENTAPIRILHIGDSHVQMGHFSNAIREGLQAEFGGNELGFFFPNILSGGYNPAGINIQSKSNWKCATNSKPDSTIQVGVTGASAQTVDSISTIQFAFKGLSKIKTVTIYHQKLDSLFQIRCDGAVIQTIDNKQITAYTTITLPEEASEINVEIVKLTATENQLSIYGVSMNQLKTEGIDYHAFGVSGNQYQFFATLSPLFKAQVEDLQADLIIFSIGSNDAYRKDIDSVAYQKTINQLISEIRKLVPKTRFLITFPPDTKYDNKRPDSEKIVLNCIQQASKSMKVSAWDFHSVMGGFDSNANWQELNLASKDGLHLSTEGYRIEGALFNIALAKALKNKYPKSKWFAKTAETYEKSISKIKLF